MDPSYIPMRVGLGGQIWVGIAPIIECGHAVTDEVVVHGGLLHLTHWMAPDPSATHLGHLAVVGVRVASILVVRLHHAWVVLGHATTTTHHRLLCGITLSGRVNLVLVCIEGARTHSRKVLIVAAALEALLAELCLVLRWCVSPEAGELGL